MQKTFPQSLDRLARNQTARVSGFAEGVDNLVVKLREIGFAEGDEVELLARGWLGGAPLSVRLNRTVIALRKNEAAAVKIEVAPETAS
jgi:Fe2+ transport system protein FeoA